MGSSSSRTRPETTRGSGTVGDHKMLDYAASRMQGKRQYMEDADAMVFGIGGYQWVAMFGIFDGHGGLGGQRASQYIADNLLSALTDHLPESKGGENVSKHLLVEATLSAFEDVDEMLRGLPKFAAPSKFGCQCSPPTGFMYAGSTAEVCFITPDEFVVANLGDSRVVICRDGKLAFQTEDHKPWEQEELNRIRKAGGYYAKGRVNGTLAVSRSLGDFAFKRNPNLGPDEQILSCFPWVTIIDRHPLDEFIIVACDGIWDVFTSDEAVEFVIKQMKSSKDMGFIAERMVKEAYKRGSGDNLTCIVVRISDLVFGSNVSETSTTSTATTNHHVSAKHCVRRHSRHESIYIPEPEDGIDELIIEEVEVEEVAVVSALQSQDVSVE